MSLLIQIKKELSQVDAKPKKTLGQNFLINESVYHKIVTALEIKPTDVILEIGPGLGTLTEYLAQTWASVFGVEKDHKLAEYLKQKFQNNPKIEIIEGDVLTFDIRHSTFDIRNYKIVGNIPYYLTSHLFRIIFGDWPTPQSAVFMIQKEVAQRIVAKPPKMSLLGVSVQYYAEPKIINYVSSKSFWPEPGVDSAIIKLVPSDWRLVTSANPNSEFQIPNSHNTKKFFSIVKAGFAGKRKQLANNLARELNMPKQTVEEKLQSVKIDPKRRAETLTIKEWQNITTTLSPR